MTPDKSKIIISEDVKSQPTEEKSDANMPQEVAYISTTSKRLVINAGIQCDASSDLIKTGFYITNINLRRAFVRKLYMMIILQELITLPVIYTFLHWVHLEFNILFYHCVCLLLLIINVFLSFGHNRRRKSPINYIALLITVSLNAIQEGIFAKVMETHLTLLNPVVIILQLILLIIYTKVNSFRLTTRTAIVTVLIVTIIYVCAFVFWFHNQSYNICIHAFVYMCFIVYVTQVMLTAESEYHLEADEYIFATTNIYADIPKYLWAIFKALFLHEIITVAKFIKKTGRTEIW